MDLRDQLQANLSGSYTLQRELGGGGMARVFVAEDTPLGRKVESLFERCLPAR
jgi:eukaryotic-like serine/threonine-protein kinase